MKRIVSIIMIMVFGCMLFLAACSKGAPFDMPFYILLNVAVGGTFEPEAELDNTEFPVEMKVDFVRVYQRSE